MSEETLFDEKEFDALTYEEKSAFLSDAFSITKTLLFAGRAIPAWWTPQRDEWLRAFVIGNQFMSNSVGNLLYLLNSVDFIVLPKNSGVSEHIKQAAYYNDLMRNITSSDGFEMFLNDVLTCDNGGWLYVEAIEPSDQPISTFAFGLRHLDSNRVQRTGDMVYPAIYWSDDSNGYKMHHSRIINLTQNPQSFQDTYGVGLSFVSRTILYTRHLLDIQTYEDELLGSRSASEIIMLTGANANSLKKAIDGADIESDNSGLTRYGKRVYIGIREANAKLERVLLKGLPDNFNKQEDFQIMMSLVALAAGVAIEHFPISGTSSASKSGANFAEGVSNSKLIKWFVDKLSAQITSKFLPNSLYYTDVESASRLNSERSKVLRDLAFSSRVRIQFGITTARQERKTLLDQGALSQSEFEELELQDGRLPNGMPLIDIFYTTDPAYQRYFSFITLPIESMVVNNDLLIQIKKSKNDAANTAVNSTSGNLQSTAKTAYFALQELEKVLSIGLRGPQEPQSPKLPVEQIKPIPESVDPVIPDAGVLGNG